MGKRGRKSRKDHDGRKQLYIPQRVTTPGAETLFGPDNKGPFIEEMVLKTIIECKKIVKI